MTSAPSLNPNPPKFVHGAQIRAARALLGWRRSDLAAAARLHPNAVSYWEKRGTLPRREPVGCSRMRLALLAAGVITVNTPAPGVCLLRRDPAAGAVVPSSAPAAGSIND